jgi:hypothetical protein
LVRISYNNRETGSFRSSAIGKGLVTSAYLKRSACTLGEVVSV